MNLNVTNIKIDNEYVDEVLWVKSGETSIHTGMTIGTPLKFNVDEYTLENPGETAIITVKTDNNIYRRKIMSKNLVIVESPAKSKTIEKYLY